MLVRSWIPALLLIIALFATVAAACDDESSAGLPPDPDATATSPPTQPASAGNMREEDLTARVGLSEVLAETNGEVDPGRIIYADLTESGIEEAVVPVSSGGEGGDIAIFVYGYAPDGDIEELLREVPDESSIQAEVQGEQLVTTQGAYAPGDPLCCPSELLVRYYVWDGTALVVEREEQMPAP
jgi:hypothetical protein